MRSMLVAAVMLGGAAHAAELPVPICADPRVLQEVDTMIRARGQVLVLEPVPIGEVSTAVPGVAAPNPPNSPPLAHCSVRGHITGYDTNRHGMTPVYEPFIVNYTIEMRHNGLFVSLN